MKRNVFLGTGFYSILFPGSLVRPWERGRESLCLIGLFISKIDVNTDRGGPVTETRT